MKHILALGIKFILIGIIIFSIFSAFEGTSIAHMLLMTILLTGLSYIAGDLIILPRFGNVMASIGDIAMAFLFLWFYGFAFQEGAFDIGLASISSAIAVGFGEAFFHAYYMENRVFGRETYSEEDRHVKINPGKLRTESSSEIFPYDTEEYRKRDKEDK
ncbi:YndM family protein [Salirhabdus salicampi]|uniref:YndM family protein n=1 Tax=Salirhabdus salicampi TaxID=476102 RepID=UPI0020C241A3|nr:YndM family protein [Salirhabdus salicampi]MCP8615458.1 YndM family protein [Salirhabdus salicampi]